MIWHLDRHRIDKEREEGAFFRGLQGSLATRVLLIATLLLVLPLLFLVGFLYYEDVQLKGKDNLLTLKLLINRSDRLITHAIEEEKEFLDALELLFDREDWEDGEREANLAELARRNQASSFFRLVQREGRYLCDIASSSDFVGRDCTALVDLAKRGISLIAFPANIDALSYLIRMSPDRREAWAIALPIATLIDKLGFADALLYPTNLSLIGEGESILFSTAKQFIPHAIYQKGTGQMFSFMLNGREYLGVEKPMSEANFSLLVSMPANMHFIDTPHFLNRVFGFLGLVVALGGGGTIFLTLRLAIPLKQLCRVMRDVSQGRLSARFRRDPMGFEINVLGLIFNEMIDALLQHMKVEEQERLDKEMFAKELLLGQKVQNSILPRALPTFPGLDIAAHFASAREVGGDFYDFSIKETRGEKQLMISIADTADQGIFACLYSLSLRSMLRSYGEACDALGTIISETNNLFCSDTKDSGVFVTAWVALFNPDTKVLHYTNCGHYPAFLKRVDGSLEKLSTEGIALGAVSLDRVSTREVQLASGDILLLFTDGLVEAHNEKMELFGEERILEVFDAEGDRDVRDIVSDLVEKVSSFMGKAAQHDDLTIVIVKVL